MVDTLEMETSKRTVFFDEPPFDSLDITEIMACLPHAYPFLLVDRVTALTPPDLIFGYKNVTINEPFFQGHFPGNPIMPGVLIIEALAQLGCIFMQYLPQTKGKLGMFTGLDGIRIRRPVRPGDRLDLCSQLLKLKGPLGKAYVKATVNGELVCDGGITFAMVAPEAKTAEDNLIAVPS